MSPGVTPDNDALKIQDKIDQLFEDADSLDWKGLFEKDSSRTLHNAIKQSYYVSDAEFWRRYKSYVDSEIDEVVQIRRDYRRILWRFREVNAERLERGDYAVNIQDVIEDFYATHAPHDVSNLRKFFENKQGLDNIYENITGQTDIGQPPTVDELAGHVNELNTVKALSAQPLPRSGATGSLLGQLARREPAGQKEGLEIAKEIGGMGEALDVLWNFDNEQAAGQEKKIKLNKREQELVEDVRKRFQDMVQRKQQMDITGRTVRKVISVKLMQAELFELVCQNEFASSLRRIAEKQRGSATIKDARVRTLFSRLRGSVYQHAGGQLLEFAEKWGLILSDADEDSLESNQMIKVCVDGLRQRLVLQDDRAHSLDMKAQYLEYKLEEMGDQYLFEGEWQKKAISLEMLNEFEDLLMTMRQVFTDDLILKKLLRNQTSVDRDVQAKVTGLFRRSRAQAAEDLEALRRSLQKATEDDSEDLAEGPIFAKYKFQLQDALEKQRHDNNILNLKILVFNVKVNELRNQQEKSKIRNAMIRIKRNLKISLKKLEDEPKSPAKERQILELKRLIKASNTKDGESLLLHMHGHPDLQFKLQEENWFKTFNNYIEDQVSNKNWLKRLEDLDLRTKHEMDKLEAMGLQKYLVEEIGLRKFLGADSYDTLRRRIEEETRGEHSARQSPHGDGEGYVDDWQMGDHIIEELVGETSAQEHRQKAMGDEVKGSQKGSRTGGLNRELKLVSMKLRLIDEEMKDVQEEEQTKYFNKVIRVEESLRKLRENGHEPTSREVLQMISDWDLEDKNALVQYDNMNPEGDSVFKMHFKQKQRRYIEAKARVLIDYLLRFDPEFRGMYVRSKSIEEMGSRVESGIRSALENKEFLDNFDILSLNPEYFSLGKKSLMLCAIEKAIKRQLPTDLFDSRHVLVNDGLESFVSDNILSLCQKVEQRLITDETEIRALRRTTKVAELEYMQNLRSWIDRAHPPAEVDTGKAPEGFRNDRDGVEHVMEQPLLLGKLLREQGHLTQEDLVEALRNPTFENKERVSELLLSSLRKFNELPENDPYYIELVEALFDAKMNRMDSREVQSASELQAVADKIEKQGFSLEKSALAVDLSGLDPLNPPQLSDFEKTPDVIEINECLLGLVKQHDLSELGITPSFVSVLEEFMGVLRQRQNVKTGDAISLQIVTGKAKVDSMRDDHFRDNTQGYFPKNMGLLDRRDHLNMLSEQLVATEANVRQYRQQFGPRLDALTGHLAKQKVYRVDPSGEVITREEFVLTNGGIFNVDEEEVEQEETEQLLYR